MRLSERAAAALQVGGAIGAQTGAAVGATAMPFAGAPALVAMRQTTAALVLLAVARPPLRRLAARDWGAVTALAAAFVVMNLGVYLAIERIGLGLTVALEFLGPLAVALLASRRWRDWLIALAAGAGVALLTGSVPGLDAAGILFALGAAVAWGSYILLSRRIGVRLPGVQGTALGVALAAIVTMPLLIAALVRLDGAQLVHFLVAGAAAGILTTAVAPAIDMIVLRRMRPELFGVLQSAQPGLAALMGFLVLQQTLHPAQLLGLAFVSAANAVAVLLARARPAAPDRTETAELETGAPPATGPVGIL